MKNIQISDNDVLSKRFNGHDLHFYLKDEGIDAKEIVWNKLSDSPSTMRLAGQVLDRESCNQLITKMEQHYDAQSVLYPFSFDLLHHQDFLEADIVHLHLIHNYFFNIMHLPILTRLKPIVWTLHDPWLLSGHCVHSFSCKKWVDGCGYCPDMESSFPINRDTSALNWEVKKVYLQASQFDIIVASRWMLDQVKQSPFLSHCKTHLIPFGIDLEKFRPQNQSLLKKEFNIPDENFVLAFRAASWPLKGLTYIKEMLQQLNPTIPITLIVTSELGLVEDLKKKYQVIECGWVRDDYLLAKTYAVADVFLMPSLAESFGMSAIEAMACKTPVVAFENTVLSETIDAPNGGIVVKKGCATALKQVVEQLYFNKDLLRNLSNSARLLAEKKYDKKDYVKKIIAVYQEIIARNKVDSRINFIINEQLKHANLGKTSFLNPPVLPFQANNTSVLRNPNLLKRVAKLLVRGKKFKRLVKALAARYNSKVSNLK